MITRSMEINVQLYSILRDRLPSDARGKTILQLEDGATLSDILEEFGISRRVVIGVNGEHETDRSRRLHDQDDIKIFSSVSGG